MIVTKTTGLIVIGVNYTRDFYISKDLIVKIEQIFSNESIKIQNDFMENCNIVISDCPLKHLPSHIKNIYFKGNHHTRRLEKK